MHSALMATEGYKVHVTKTYRISGHIASRTVPTYSEPLELSLPFFYGVPFQYLFYLYMCCIRP